MEEAQPEKLQRIGTRSSIRRKPFSDLTNLIPKPHRNPTSSSQLKKPTTSADPAMSLSSTGSTQNHCLMQHQVTVPRDQHPPPTPRTPGPVILNLAHTPKRRYDSVGVGKHIAYSGRPTMIKTRSMTKATGVPVSPIHLEKTKHDTMKAKNNMRDFHIPLSGIKIHDNDQPFVPLSCPPVKNGRNNTKGTLIPHSTRKMKDKSQEISMPLPPRYPPMEKTINMVPLSGVKFNYKGKEAVVGSNLFDLSKIYEGEMVAKSINYGAQEKMNEGSSSRYLLRTRSQRNEANEPEVSLHSKLPKVPLPDNKKRSSSSKKSSKKFALPQDFIDQQRAYFKEIDEYELEVEETEQVSA